MLIKYGLKKKNHKCEVWLKTQQGCFLSSSGSQQFLLTLKQETVGDKLFFYFFFPFLSLNCKTA